MVAWAEWIYLMLMDGATCSDQMNNKCISFILAIWKILFHAKAKNMEEHGLRGWAECWFNYHNSACISVSKKKEDGLWCWLAYSIAGEVASPGRSN